jgi:nucleotide-binding universal stress UspA family protein
MYRHILVPTDGSPLSLKAAKAAAGIAKDLGARITAVFVVEPFEPYWTAEIRALAPDPIGAREYEKISKKRGDAALKKVVAIAQKAGVACATLIENDPAPWKVIVRTAKAKKCDLIAMSSNGRRGLEALLLGSQTSKVLTHAKVPVLVCR